MAHDEFDDFFGDDAETPVTDTRADGRLYRVPLTRLAPNLVNPRKDFGTEDDLIDFGKSLQRRQNQPCPVVSRTAYLKLWPEHVGRVKDIDYVLVSGERRYRGASAVGLAALDCVANDDFAKDRRTFMEAVVSENVDRQNFDPVEEAYAVEALVREFGTGRAVAQHFERVDGWVTQRILLTHLAPEAQDLVRKKAMPLDAARTLGKLARDNGWDAAGQLDWWQTEQDRRAAAAAARKAARAARVEPSVAAAQPVPAPAAVQPSFTAVKLDPAAPPEPAPAATSAPADYHAVIVRDPAPRTTPAPVAATQGDSLPEQRSEPAPAVHDGEVPEGVRRFPYEDSHDAAQYLIRKMPADVLEELTDLLIKHRERAGTSAR